jgi:hypothetical protein
MKFYYFSFTILRPYLNAKFRQETTAMSQSVLSYNLAEHSFGDSAYQKLHALNKCFSSRPYGLQQDITGHINHPFNIKTKTPYEYGIETRSFGNLCLDTAARIYNSTDRDIAVLWSGGIDSTAVLVSIMQTVPTERLIVVCNQASIKEFPSFYDQKIRGQVRIMSTKELFAARKDVFIVSGDGGDTVWGVIDESFWGKSSHVIHQPWQDHINRDILDDIDFVEEFCSWSGRPIKTWLELRTWFYLCAKWQDKCMRIYYLWSDLTDKDAQAFYDVDGSFQCWTMNNLDKIIGKTWEEYKMPAKQFIYDFHNDNDYFRHKSKVNSDKLENDLISKESLAFYRRFVIPEDFSSIQLKSWPFIDYAEIEDFNNQHMLIPSKFLS